jgi:hypothetical protein
MSTVTKYVLRNADDQEVGSDVYDEDELDQAIEVARATGTSVVALEFEFSDSSVVPEADFAGLLTRSAAEPDDPEAEETSTGYAEVDLGDGITFTTPIIDLDSPRRPS